MPAYKKSRKTYQPTHETAIQKAFTTTCKMALATARFKTESKSNQATRGNSIETALLSTKQNPNYSACYDSFSATIKSTVKNAFKTTKFKAI